MNGKEELNHMCFTLRMLAQADPQAPQAEQLYRLFTEARLMVEALGVEYERLLGVDVEAIERDHVARGGRLWRDIYDSSSNGETAAQHDHDECHASCHHSQVPQLEVLTSEVGRRYLGIPLADSAIRDDRGGSHE